MVKSLSFKFGGSEFRRQFSAGGAGSEIDVAWL